jgi:hypothetical protein
MSFAEEEPPIDLEWSDYEVFAMRDDLELLREREAYNFITLQVPDGNQIPFETFLGGVIRPDKPNPTDVWISILKLGNAELTTLVEGKKKYHISASDVVVKEGDNPDRPANRYDVGRIRFLLNPSVGHWSKNDSRRIAEKLHETDKRQLTYWLFPRLSGPWV